MKHIAYKGVEEKVMFSAANYYGANLKVSVLNDDTGVYIANGVPLTEIIEPFTELTALISGDHIQNSELVTLVDCTGLTASDRVSIGNGIYRITKVSLGDNTITIHRGLEEAIVDGASCYRVGNTGLYKVRIVFSELGSFVIQAKDTKYGIQKSESLVIRDKSLEEMFEFTNSEINENERYIKEYGTYTILA